jgi:hypothetical protein
MATKAHRLTRHRSRFSRLRQALSGDWLLALIARMIATILVAILTRWLHLPAHWGG